MTERSAKPSVTFPECFGKIRTIILHESDHLQHFCRSLSNGIGLSKWLRGQVDRGVLFEN